LNRDIGDIDDTEPLNFPINAINSVIFQGIVGWMVEHDGQPSPAIQENPNTGQVFLTILEAHNPV
jgi:hypothetical protein